MRCERKSAAYKGRGYRNTWIQVTRRRVCDQHPGRNTNEGVDNIPNAVNIWDLVREKFNDIQAGRKADDPPVIQHIQATGKLHTANFLQQSEDGDSCIKVYPARPRRTQRQT